MPAPIIHETARVYTEYLQTVEQWRPHRTVTLSDDEEAVIVDGCVVWAIGTDGVLLRLASADRLRIPEVSRMYDALDNPAVVAAEYVGFELIDTGGGTTAWKLLHGEDAEGERYTLIVKSGEPQAPTSLRELVCCTYMVYGDEDSRTDGLAFAEILLDVFGPEEGCPLPEELIPCL